jgi:hypothetical protein
VWNLVFTPKLTQEGFKSDANVPSWILILETILRVIVFALPLLLPLQLKDQWSKMGLTVYIVGTLIYFGSWLPLVYRPNTQWSTTALGLLAPAYTPLILLIGLGLVGHSWVYVLLSVLFILVHTVHNVLSFGYL